MKGEIMPLELWVRNSNKALIPATDKDAEAFDRLPQNTSFKVYFKAPRSGPHHNLFFAAITLAQMNWPETHEFKPDSMDHLRAWLLCKAGYRDVETHTLEDPGMADTVVNIVVSSIKQAKKHGFAVYDRNNIYVLTPKSISWGKLKQKEFNEISQKVSDVLNAEIGRTLDDFKRELDKAA